MIWFFIFWVISHGEEIIELAKTEKELENEAGLVSDLVHELKDISQESYIMSVMTEINNLRDNLFRIGRSLDNLDRFASELAKSTMEINENKTRDAIASFDKLGENLSALEGKIVEYEEKDLHQKIKKNAEEAENFDKDYKAKLNSLLDAMKSIETELESVWIKTFIHILLGVACIILFFSWKILNKALK
ncbi:unnamed protein product [Blepharisma stoltei]|uniref:Uncharacterized protein n=1 Tax=Blepharisma stoltei TaxID=1481888 RepID=A0AAU9JNP2_9CILI|nr:unnamed protein product [Blepharisma stoltei]